MADARASKARDRKIMWVRLPPPVLFLLTFGKYSPYCITMRNITPITWTSNLAYVIGLIATDGNLSKDGRHITMRSSDKNLLETFKICLGIKDKIAQSVNDGYAKKPSYRVQFSNAKFYRWLNSIGLTPAKTYTIGSLEIPDLYFRDFLRGHLDGDGSIFTYTDKYNYYLGRNYINQRVYMKFISASQTHIKWLHKKIQELSKLNGSLLHNIPAAINRVTIWEIKFSKKESIKLLNWIYYHPNLPCLERKRVLAQQILALIANEKRKVYTKISYS